MKSEKGKISKWFHTQTLHYSTTSVPEFELQLRTTQTL